MTAAALRKQVLLEQMRQEHLDAVLVHGTGALGQYGDFHAVTGSMPGNKGAWAALHGDGTVRVFASSSADAAAFTDAGIPTEQVQVVAGTDDVVSRLLDTAAVGAGGRVGLLVARAPYPDVHRVRQQLVHAQVNTLLHPGLSLVRRALEPGDAETIRSAADRVEQGLRTAKQSLHVGISERRLAGRIHDTLVSHGATVTIVQVGRGRFAAAEPTDACVQDGDVVTVFVEAAGSDGWWVEAGQLFHVGDVGDAARAISTDLIDRMRSAGAALRSETPLSDIAATLDQATAPRRTIGMGHLTGIDEVPESVTSTSPYHLVAGDLIALHPSADLGDRAAAVANTFLVGDSNAKALSDLPFHIGAITA